VLICYIECQVSLAFIEKWYCKHCYCTDIDFVNIYCSIAYYQKSHWLYEVLTSKQACTCNFIVALSWAGDLIGYYFRLSLLAISQTFWSGGDLWGGLLSLSLAKPFAFSKPQVTGDVSLGPYLPKQKEPSHWGDSGGIGSSYASLTSFHLPFTLTTNWAITSTINLLCLHGPTLAYDYFIT